MSIRFIKMLLDIRNRDISPNLHVLSFERTKDWADDSRFGYCGIVKWKELCNKYKNRVVTRFFIMRA